MIDNRNGTQIKGVSLADDLSFQHLMAELTRIDLLILRQVRLWQLAGQDPNDDFRGLYVSDETAAGLLNRPLGMNWGAVSTLRAEEARWFEDALTQAGQKSRSLQQAARKIGQPLRLETLSKIFHLDNFELDTLLICACSRIDLRYERLFGYLQDDVTRKRPTVNLVLDLLCQPGPQRLAELARFQADSPLFTHHLLERQTEANKTALLNQVLSIDESLISWLLGNYHASADIFPYIELLDQPIQSDNQALAGPALSFVERGTFDESSRFYQSILACYGADIIGQETMARLIAQRLGKPLFRIDLNAGNQNEGGDVSPSHLVKLALRDARLLSAIPVITHWDSILTDGAPPAGLLQEILKFPHLVILSGQSPWQISGIERNRRFSWLEFPVPSYSERRALWSYYLQQPESEADLGLTTLAGQFLLTGSQIRDAMATALDWAAQRGEPVNQQDLLAAARFHSSSHLTGLARKIVPRYTWQDLILPADQMGILREIIGTVRSRPTVLAEWGLGQKLVSSAGITVLFAGPPGTGKTMAAEIIAGELGLDLYKIDLSTIVSKYIGETEKNLEHIFLEAETSNTILFFDEADAIFGKRSEVKDAHDRYANIEISYLLQRMEAYDGVTILATNLRSNLDEAFTRRLQFAVDFPFPEEEERLRIWQTLLPKEAPREENLDLPLLARRYKFAGGNIRNILVSAAYLAAANGGKISMAHLVHGARRELRKMGRLVGEQEAGEGQVDRSG
jgi:hypothetical protein